MTCILRKKGSGIKPGTVHLRLGEASFALYLLHFPIVMGIHRFVYDWTLPSRVAVAVAVLVTAVGASLVAHVWFERPLERQLRGGSPRPLSVDATTGGGGGVSAAG